MLMTLAFLSVYLMAMFTPLDGVVFFFASIESEFGIFITALFIFVFTRKMLR